MEQQQASSDTKRHCLGSAPAIAACVTRCASSLSADRDGDCYSLHIERVLAAQAARESNCTCSLTRPEGHRPHLQVWGVSRASNVVSASARGVAENSASSSVRPLPTQGRSPCTRAARSAAAAAARAAPQPSRAAALRTARASAGALCDGNLGRRVWQRAGRGMQGRATGSRAV